MQPKNTPQIPTNNCIHNLTRTHQIYLYKHRGIKDLLKIQVSLFINAQKLYNNKNIKTNYSGTYFQLQPLLKHMTGQQNSPPHRDIGLGLRVLR